MYGKKVWLFPDGERPPFGQSELQGHESFVIFNPNEEDAHVQAVLYYEDAQPDRIPEWIVPAQRVRCFRSHLKEDFGEYTLEINRQYAVKIESSVPVIIQYGRLDPRQSNLAFYTTMGYTDDD